MGNMESMANGMPIITTNCGGVPYVVNDKAIICKQKSVDDIENAIEKFIKDQSLVCKMSLEARKFVEDNYNIGTIFNKWIEVINNFEA